MQGRMLATLVAMALVTRGAAAQAGGASKLAPFEKTDFTKQPISAAQLKPLDEFELGDVRGLIFGRHGRVFKEVAIQQYLETRPWYRKNAKFANAMLNDVERKSLDVVREAEARAHDHVQLGDMRFYQTKPLTVAMLGQHTGAEWRILRAEVEAEHGKRFDDQPWIQEYFDDRYWYAVDPLYSPKMLSPIERANMATIDSAQKSARDVALSPGDMKYWQAKPLTDSMLHGLSLYELRLLRNEVYALHGYAFKTPWINKTFYAEDGDYIEDATFKESMLSPTEQKNVATIVRAETAIHEKLALEPVDTLALSNLYLEDARKLRYEIYARHGKIFANKWLQSYFKSLAWYKPDPHYRDASLNPIERANALRIAAYEKTALSVMTALEG
ncbi:MAG: YARHG domain-containing protein [Gemmatimonadaceae bacterium]